MKNVVEEMRQAHLFLDRIYDVMKQFDMKIQHKVELITAAMLVIAHDTGNLNEYLAFVSEEAEHVKKNKE